MRRNKKVFGLLICFLLILASSSKSINKTEKVDICVYGGTSAGVIAAYTASLNGKKVLLIEPGTHLGGMSSGGLGYTDIGNKYVVKGLALDFYRQLGKHYGKLEQWIFEPSVAENVFNDYVKKGNVKVLYNYRLQALEKDGSSITEIIVENSKKPEVSTNKRVKAKVFIDCSYEGDLMAKSGASYTVGREANSVYNETYNGVQLMDGHQFWDYIDPYIIKGDSTSGVIWGVSNNKLQTIGSGDKKVQAYNFRVCLTNVPDNMIPITKPDKYNPDKYELVIRLQNISPRKSIYDFFIWSRMPNGKTDINNAGGISTDMIGMSWDYPEANYDRRQEIWNEHEDYTKGLFYFLGHDERIPEHIRNEMLKWGYPKDEYIDNRHWSHQLYVREARRMIGELVMTQHHCQGREVVKDAVGWAAYTMDSHNCDRLVVNGSVKNEGNIEAGGFPPYPISYRSIVPQKKEVDNLIVPVCLSASHIAYGSIRMEPVFMVLAQSAAVAACLSIDGKTSVQEIDVAKLQKVLEYNPLADGSTPEIIIDNDNKKCVTILGDWIVNTDIHRTYGLSNLLDKSKGSQIKSVKYIPEITTGGFYEIYHYSPKPLKGEKISFTTFYIFDGKKITEKQIWQNVIKYEGQTSGEWVNLGKYYLSKGTSAYVNISNKNADNIVTADAVLFVPLK